MIRTKTDNFATLRKIKCLTCGLMKEREIEQLIEKEIDKTEKLIEMYTEETQPVEPDCAIDILSRNEAMNSRNITSSSLIQAKAKLAALEFVLSKVGTAEFGKCVRCRKEIPLGRILVRPESLLCMECSE